MTRSSGRRVRTGLVHRHEQNTHGDVQEVLLVMAASVTLWLGGAVHRLETGDSIEFRSSTPHRFDNDTEVPAEVVWMCSPPTLDPDR